MARKRDPNSFVFQVLVLIMTEANGEPVGLKGKVILRKLGEKVNPSGLVRVSRAVRIIRREYGLPIVNGQSPDDGYWLAKMPSDVLSTVNRFLDFGMGLNETLEAVESAQEMLQLRSREYTALLESMRQLTEEAEEGIE